MVTVLIYVLIVDYIARLTPEEVELVRKSGPAPATATELAAASDETPELQTSRGCCAVLCAPCRRHCCNSSVEKPSWFRQVPEIYFL